jgi:hypothetical protein
LDCISEELRRFDYASIRYSPTAHRYVSGEIDWTGRISKCGDKMLRSYLYEAANVMLTHVARWSALKAWGIRIAKRTGLRKAKVAVARKFAVVLPTGFGSMAPDSNGQRRSPINLRSRQHSRE